MNNETPETIQRLVDALIDDDAFTRFFLKELCGAAKGWTHITNALLTHCEDSSEMAVSLMAQAKWRDRLELVMALNEI